MDDSIVSIKTIVKIVNTINDLIVDSLLNQTSLIVKERVRPDVDPSTSEDKMASSEYIGIVMAKEVKQSVKYQLVWFAVRFTIDT